uniref:(northern house mosquito) hypothetical protein n=1 Tax=Culex pipiens TaxID=7175 RepID=A0A8D8HMS2_CULPI
MKLLCFLFVDEGSPWGAIGQFLGRLCGGQHGRSRSSFSFRLLETAQQMCKRDGTSRLKTLHTNSDTHTNTNCEQMTQTGSFLLFFFYSSLTMSLFDIVVAHRKFFTS